MDVDDLLDVGAVAAPADDRQRSRRPPCCLEHQPVAFEEPRLRESQPADTVAGERVGPGDVEHEVGPAAGERLLDRRSERRQVLVVTGAVLQPDVERSGMLAQREVSRAVDRHREHGGIGAENLRRAVALVDVAVEDQHPVHRPAGLHLPGGDGGVVEQAVALPPVAAGMMRAAGKAGGQAVGEGGGGRIDRRAGRTQRPLHQRRAPGEADPGSSSG